MSFSSPGFLFFFMPLVFLLYFALPGRARNALLLVASLAFYCVDAVDAALVLLGSVVVNFAIGLCLQRLRGRAARWLLSAGVLANVAPLIYYKYTNFLLASAQDVAGLLDVPFSPAVAEVVLPAGISFFTFQGISYLVDTYRREVPASLSLVDFGMYHTLFPQLIAGPIVRYREVADRIRARPARLDDVYEGLLRFCLGLGKKIILADQAGVVADHAFGLPPGELGMGMAWLGALAYSVQILFDFSGYSDMAIGMGRMLGFRFPENFDRPYRATSVTDFWRRWHMTLSRWFRDYVYIPMGGNRVGQARTCVNLLVVFVLCGLWHGAAYTFLLWGLWHGLLLAAERVALSRFGWRPGGLAGWAATLLLVVMGWVMFRAPGVEAGLSYLAAMAGLGGGVPAVPLGAVLTADKLVFLLAGTALALVPASWQEAVAARGAVARPVGAVALFAYSAVLIAANGFNPFIYFRF